LVAIARIRVTGPCVGAILDVRTSPHPDIKNEKSHQANTSDDLDAESLQLTYDPALLPYTTLLAFFYRMHDPTTKNRQGMDTGTQYRSAIFYHSAEQKAMAEEVTEKVQRQWWKKGTVSTEVLEAGRWWDAEEYHQGYLERNPGGYECPAHFLRKFPEME